MFHLPPLPAWEALHPLVIHFPVVLLLVAPLFIVIGAVLAPRHGRPYLLTAVFLLLLGTATLFVAASTGEAAAELAQRDEVINKVLNAHQQAAFELRVIFSTLSALLLVILALPAITSRGPSRLWSTALPLLFLIPYAFGVLVLVNTAHQGGMLVHQFGVHAMMPPDSAPASHLPAED